jgi:hypothetical protein
MFIKYEIVSCSHFAEHRALHNSGMTVGYT